MYCLVCGKEMSERDGICPVCDFRPVEILGDLDAALEQMRPTIEAHRNEFMKKCTVGIVSYNYVFDDAAGKMKPDGEEIKTIGTLDRLYGKTVGFAEDFDSPSKRSNVELTVLISTPNGEQRQKLALPNRYSEKAVKLAIKVKTNKESRIVYQFAVSGGDDNDNKEFCSEEKVMF